MRKNNQQRQNIKSIKYGVYPVLTDIQDMPAEKKYIYNTTDCNFEGSLEQLQDDQPYQTL